MRENSADFINNESVLKKFEKILESTVISRDQGYIRDFKIKYPSFEKNPKNEKKKRGNRCLYRTSRRERERRRIWYARYVRSEIQGLDARFRRYLPTFPSKATVCTRKPFATSTIRWIPLMNSWMRFVQPLPHTKLILKNNRLFNLITNKRYHRHLARILWLLLF